MILRGAIDGMSVVGVARPSVEVRSSARSLPFQRALGVLDRILAALLVLDLSSPLLALRSRPLTTSPVDPDDDADEDAVAALGEADALPIALRLCFALESHPDARFDFVAGSVDIAAAGTQSGAPRQVAACAFPAR